MKKILYLLLTLFGCTLLANGQDFKPGQQAQGILESKNVTVDHATGTFHYRVPLYTLKSGAFELPVTLDYTARGVRVDDLPGPVGAFARSRGTTRRRNGCRRARTPCLLL